MATDARKHTAPAAGETPRRQALNDLSLSIRDVIPVANTTARAQLITDLTNAGVGPSITNPVFVYRADAPLGFRTEITEDGTNWRPHGGALRHAEMTGPTPTFTVANATIWGLGAQTLDTAASIDAPGAISGESFAVNVTGLYAVSVWVMYSSLFSGRSLVEVRVGGVSVMRNPHTGDEYGSVAIPSLRLTAGQLVQGAVYQNSGSTQPIVSRTRVTLIRPL